MDWKFISGVLTAEASAQIGLALTLGYAFWRMRLEREHLLFAVLSLTISIQTFASLGLSLPGHANPHLASVIVHVVLAFASAIHVHFVLTVVRLNERRSLVYALYGLAFALSLLILSPAWPAAPAFASGREYAPLVFPVLETPPALVVYAFYGASLLELGLSLWLLATARSRGRNDLSLIMWGIIVVVVAAAADISVMLGWGRQPFVLSHAFSTYGFFVALSLLIRYRKLVLGFASTESSLNARTEELRKSYAELEQVQRELSSKKQLAAVGELAAAIAHEVRNPLAIIVNAVAGLRRPSLEEGDRQTLLGIVDEETARLNRLVTDLLRFARPVTLRRTSVALPELVRRAETSRGNQHKFEIHLPDDPELRVVQADANLLRLVFDNLVANACQAMPEGGVVKIVIGDGRLNGRSCVMIEIVDHGHGMDETVLRRAVDPFFTTRPSGTGLGLPIVQRIVAAHGGALQIDSEPQHGTTVRMLLPREPSDGDSTAMHEAGPRT